MYVRKHQGKGLKHIFKRLFRSGIGKVAKAGVKKLAKNKNVRTLVKLGVETLKNNPKLKDTIANKSKQVISNIANDNVKRIVTKIAEIPEVKKEIRKVLPKEKTVKKVKSKKPKKKAKKRILKNIREKQQKGWRRLNNTTSQGAGIILD